MHNKAVLRIAIAPTNLSVTCRQESDESTIRL